MSYDGRSLVNFILDFCDSRGRKITNLSLQKIAYFCHVWSLIELKRPLVKQNFEAWEFGPVLPYIYREFKAFERTPIKGRATGIDPDTGQLKVVSYSFDFDTQKLIEKVTDFYSQIKASDLVELSHAKGGPWHKIWNHTGIVNPGMKIANDDIIRFYSSVPQLFTIQ